MQPLVKTTDLYLAFGGVVAADNIDFELHTGERLAAIGQNGAGKTTTLRTILGLTPYNGGSVRVLGFDIPRQSREARFRIGVVPQMAPTRSRDVVFELLKLSNTATSYPDSMSSTQVWLPM